MKKPPIILIDGNCIGARSVFTVGNLSYQEMPTGVIYGFLKEVQRIFEEFESNRICFFWDSRTSLRKLIFPNYKVKRHDNRTQREKDTWALAYEQYNKLQTEILPFIGWNNQFLEEGYEADDLLCLATQTLKAKADDQIIMVTSDEDLYQCLDLCDIYNPAKKNPTEMLFTKRKFHTKYGINPMYWADVKAIAGCSSDEVPGIVGVGEKTAIKFLIQDLPRTTKAYQNIISPNGKAIIERNKPLVTLPFEGTPALRFQENKLKIRNFVSVCEDYGMVSLLGHYSYKSWERMMSL